MARPPRVPIDLQAKTKFVKERVERAILTVADVLDHAVHEIFLFRMPDMFWSGSTAIDGLSGNVTAGSDTATDSAGRCNRI